MEKLKKFVETQTSIENFSITKAWVGRDPDPRPRFLDPNYRSSDEEDDYEERFDWREELYDSSRNNYAPVLRHVLGLETLRSVTTNWEISGVQNNHVQKLTINNQFYHAYSLTNFFQLFPSITSLELIKFHRPYATSIGLINRSTTLEELKISKSECCIIDYLKIANLKKCDLETNDLINREEIRKFTEKHPQITDLKLNLETSTWKKNNNLELLEIVLKNLENMRSFAMKWTTDCEDILADKIKICEVIKENGANLESLTFNFDPKVLARECPEYCNDIKTEFEGYFKENLPELKINLNLVSDHTWQ
jgi:uncharacterized protein YihD (DUF1040 family)